MSLVAHTMVEPRDQDTHHANCCFKTLDDGNEYRKLNADLAIR